MIWSVGVWPGLPDSKLSNSKNNSRRISGVVSVERSSKMMTSRLG